VIDRASDGADPLSWGDPKTNGVGRHGRAHCQEAIGHAPESAFDRDVSGAPSARLIRMERKSVERVDDRRHAFPPGGDATDEAGLGAVCVDDVVPAAADVLCGFPDGRHVGPGRDVRSHVAQADDSETRVRGVVQEIAIVGGHDRHLESLPIEGQGPAQRNATSTGDEPGHDNPNSDSTMGRRHG
jgi:hypothetical protein